MNEGVAAADRRASLLMLGAATGAYVAGNATWWMQPLLIDQLISVRGLSASAAGLVVSAEMAAMAFTGFALARLLKTARFLVLAALGMGLAILSSFISIQADTLRELVFARAAAGIGTGIVLMVANASVVYFDDPDKTFARMGVVNVLFGVAMTLLVPVLHPSGSSPPVLLGLLIALCVLAPAILTMPRSVMLRARSAGAHTSAAVALSSDARMHILLLSIGAFTIGIASGVLYALYAVIGLNIGLSASSVNNTIAFAILTAIVGSSLAVLVGKSAGRVAPVTIALVLLTASIVGLSFGPGPWMFRMATCLNVMTMFFVMPYFFAAGAAQDASGRGAAYVSSAFIMSGAVSPLAGGILVDTIGTQIVGTLVVVTTAIVWSLFSYVDRQSELRHSVQPAG